MDYKHSDGGVLLPANQLVVGGRFHVDHMRGGKKIDEIEFPNLVVNEGLNHILNTVLHGGAQTATWYIGLFKGNYTPIATVTAATITAASTECTEYDESTRVAYDEAAASGQSISNTASKATFTMNASVSVYGAFLASASAKSATSGVLLAAGRFGSVKTVDDDDQLLLTYTFNAASA